MTILGACDELATPCAFYLLAAGASFTPSKREDDDLDLFGDDAEDKKTALKKLAESKKPKKRKEVENKSMLVLEIKPNTSETNIDDIAAAVKGIQMNGLTWGESVKKVPIAFGLQKLQVQCVIMDDLVSTDALIDAIEEFGMTEDDKKKRSARVDGGDDDDDDERSGLVQSAEIVSFNKL